MTRKPVVGETLYELNVGNAARHTEQKLEPTKVISVGRKYFKTLNPKWGDSTRMATEWEIDGWFEKTEYSAKSKLYESVQEYTDEKEMLELYSTIKNAHFDIYFKPKLTLDQLRRINAIIKENAT